jgi:hypothetical protein
MITFNPDTHTYKVDGVVKKSVTQTLSDVGIVDYRGVDEYYMDRGTRVHQACTLHAQGFLDWNSLGDTLPYVENFRHLLVHLRASYVSSEQPSYSKKLDIAGSYDLIVEWQGKRTLVELKTSSSFPLWVGLQLAAYETMVDVDEVMGIDLKMGKVYVKADDFDENHRVWEQIINGTFDLEEWKSNRKRRHMRKII